MGKLTNLEKVYANKPKSYLIQTLMRNGGVCRADAAKALGVKLSYFDTKLYYDRFSFEDFITLANACGYEMMFKNRYGKPNIEFNNGMMFGIADSLTGDGIEGVDGVVANPVNEDTE